MEFHMTIHLVLLKSDKKHFQYKEFEYKPQVPNNFLNNVVITPPTDPVCCVI